MGLSFILISGCIQSKSQPNLTNAAPPECTFTRNTVTGEVEDVIEISDVTNSTNTGPNRTINCPSGKDFNYFFKYIFLHGLFRCNLLFITGCIQSKQQAVFNTTKPSYPGVVRLICTDE